jgi:UDP-N-acetylglucosamine--N-acetylmuramyl-(pentapeptide) pyrophosphoryl-undecaprenol N-acetylglucosamine transferase
MPVEAERSVRGCARLFGEAWRLTGRLRPAWIVGFGGFMTVPFLVAGWLRGARLLIHEQNVIPGRANRLLAFLAKKIAVTFEETPRRLAPFNRRKAVLTRFPLRKDLRPIDKEEALRSFGLDGSRFTVLVLGGSQGAQRLNDVVPEALSQSGICDRVQVVHLHGRGDPDALSQKYRSLGIPCSVIGFLGEMARAYSAADMAVSRAGSGVLHELLRFGLPAVLVPYPHAGRHQLANAQAVARGGAALLMEEERLGPGALGQLIRILSADAVRRKTMTQSARLMCAEGRGANLVELLT